VNLSRLIDGIDVIERLNWRDVEINGLKDDSRSIGKDDLFIAVTGASADGHDFALEAVEAGAAALVVEKPVESDVPVVLVKNTSMASALLARRFYGDPSSKVLLVGITGTNGKTSTAFMLRSILHLCAGPAGIIGTVGFGSGGNLQEATHTTPSSLDLNRILAGFVEKGCRSVVMEVSSHAAQQGRIAGLEFDVGIFTNISRDHMDYHETMEHYIEAKEKLVRTLREPGRSKPEGVLVYNIDDPLVRGVGDRFEGRKISFGISDDADFVCRNLIADLSGTRFSIYSDAISLEINMDLLGRFSAWNAIGAAAAAFASGADKECIKKGLETLEEIPGRFHVVPTKTGPTVVVDYAHTPDALEKLLLFCRELSPRRLITVFGCGGDRDRGKRPIMGKVAVDNSDMVYITSDNPRSEDPDAIIRDIIEGTSGSGVPLEAVSDRGEAIRLAVGAAAAGDIVVLAGKGHEDYQVLATGKIHFSDLEEAGKALAQMEVRHQG
jgi:UDP-N-acetylmuramoyl-L-alanyl-D-glutamate--2,6-diaminopimelate ligase